MMPHSEAGLEAFRDQINVEIAQRFEEEALALKAAIARMAQVEMELPGPENRPPFPSSNQRFARRGRR